MSQTSADFRKQAEDARNRARAAKSLHTSAIERRRERALNQLADNEDWLNGNARESIRHSLDSDRAESIKR
jgi:hypothetical protein